MAHNGISLSNKKEWSIDTYHEPQVQETLHKRVYIVWFYLYTALQKTNLTCGEQNQNSGCLQGAGVKTDWEGAWRHFLGWWQCSVSWLTWVWGTYAYAKPHLMVYFRFVHFITPTWYVFCLRKCKSLLNFWCSFWSV